MRRFETSLGLLLAALITGIGSAFARDGAPLPATGYLPPGLSSTVLEPAESDPPDSAGFGSPFRDAAGRDGRAILRPDPAYRLGADSSSFGIGLDLEQQREGAPGAEGGGAGGGTWFGMGYEARRQQGGSGASMGLDSGSGPAGGGSGGASGGGAGGGGAGGAGNGR